MPRYFLVLIFYSTGAFVMWAIKGFKRGGFKKELSIYELNAQFWFYSVIGFFVLWGALELALHIYDMTHESEMERLLKEFRELKRQD